MQCPRCYFDNPAGSRVCEYCGTDLTSSKPPAKAGSSSEKRRTVLGPPPAADLWNAETPPATGSPAIDPDDPFRLAAHGIVGGAAADLAAPPTQPIPIAEVLEKQRTAVESARPEPPPPPRRGRRSTVLEEGRQVVDEAEVVGVLLVIPADPEQPPAPHLLRAGRTRIGRAGDNDLVLDDPRASSDHGMIRADPGRAWLLDTSSNGTHVSGILCVNDKVDLVDGSVLQMGRTRLVVKLFSEETLTLLRGDLS